MNFVEITTNGKEKYEFYNFINDENCLDFFSRGSTFSLPKLASIRQQEKRNRNEISSSPQDLFGQALRNTAEQDTA